MPFRGCVPELVNSMILGSKRSKLPNKLKLGQWGCFYLKKKKKAREKLIRKTEDTFHKTAQVGLYMKYHKAAPFPGVPPP